MRNAWAKGGISETVLSDICIEGPEKIEAIQPKMYIIPGRADIAIWYNRDWLNIYWDLYPEYRKLRSGLLDGLMSMAPKDGYVDRVATTIGVNPEGLLDWNA